MTDPVSTASMTREAVAPNWVLSVMNKLQPSAPWIMSYGETAEAIAQAANADPLFNEADGPKRTAAVLIALAFHESHFQPNVIGDSGHSFGLFQIQPPTARVDASLLLLPRNAAFIAIDLIRQSFKVCERESFEHKLAWYAAGPHGCDPQKDKQRGNHASALRMGLAKQLMKDHP